MPQALHAPPPCEMKTSFVHLGFSPGALLSMQVYKTHPWHGVDGGGRGVAHQDFTVE